MGRKAKVLALLLGLVLLGLGAWPLGLVCFLYLALALRHKRSPVREKHAEERWLHPRLLLTACLFVLSAAAFASGGVFSPFVFLGAGVTALLWPSLLQSWAAREFVPVSETVLLRSKYLPVYWCAVAELRPGAGPFPLAASSFSGTLMTFTDTGRTYCIAACWAYGRSGAEARLLSQLRASAPAGRAGAYLLPLDAGGAADLLKMKLTPARLAASLAKSVPAFSGLLVLECAEGSVRRASAYSIRGHAETATLPGRPKQLASALLTWEIFDAIGKRTRWPDPDPYSGLLDSMLATRGVPFAERVSQLESSGDQLTVLTLGREEVRTTRSQLRAIVALYS